MTDTSDEVVPFLKNHLDAHGGTDGAASISVNASFPAELLSLIKAELQLPFDVKLMYPDADFGEMCLMTTLGEIPSRLSGAKLKVVECRPRTLSVVEQQQHDVNISFMEKVPLFYTLSQEEKDAIAMHLIEESIEPGHPIITEGEEGHELYIVKLGGATATKAKFGKELCAYSPGDFFGELALITKKPRAASVIAQGSKGDPPCVVLKMSRLEFMVLVGKADTILQRNAAQYKLVNEMIAAETAAAENNE